MRYSEGGRFVMDDPGPPPLDGAGDRPSPNRDGSAVQDVQTEPVTDDDEARILLERSCRQLLVMVSDLSGLGLTPDEIGDGTQALVNFGEAWFPGLKLGPRLESALVLGLWGFGVLARRKGTRRRRKGARAVPLSAAEGAEPPSSPRPPPGESAPGGSADVGEVEE